MRAFILSCCVTVCRSQWPIPFVLGPDTVPNVEVSLDAPSKPLPDVSDEIGKLEADREAKQAINKDKLIRAFNKELASARFRIAALIDGAEHQSYNEVSRPHGNNAVESEHVLELATSFLKSNIVKVVVAPGKHSLESAHAGITGIEHTRLENEDAWFEAAIAEMSRLTDIVVATVESDISALLKASLSRGKLSKPVGFLQLGKGTHDHGVGSPVEANVRVVGTSVPYPTVQSLVDSFEVRRDISEEFGKAQALSMYQKLLEFENMLVDSALTTLVAKRQGAR